MMSWVCGPSIALSSLLDMGMLLIVTLCVIPISGLTRSQIDELDESIENTRVCQGIQGKDTVKCAIWQLRYLLNRPPYAYQCLAVDYALNMAMCYHEVCF